MISWEGRQMLIRILFDTRIYTYGGTQLLYCLRQTLFNIGFQRICINNVNFEEKLQQQKEVKKDGSLHSFTNQDSA